MRELRFVSAAYGDFTGDGAEDALLVLADTQRPVRSARATRSANVAIGGGVATLQWRAGGKTCEERWRFGREGEAAVKSPRQCK